MKTTRWISVYPENAPGADPREMVRIMPWGEVLLHKDFPAPPTLVDAIWHALDDRDVSVDLPDGRTIYGPALLANGVRPALDPDAWLALAAAALKRHNLRHGCYRTLRRRAA